MHLLRMIALGSIALAGMVTNAEAQKKTHKIAIQADRGKEVYRFAPARINAAPGDVVVFTAGVGAPHGVVFESKGLSEAAKKALAAAMGNRPGDLGGPTMAKEGAEYTLTIPNLPAGSYSFFCLPHRAYDVRGEITIPK